jgi:hypothetical protein
MKGLKVEGGLLRGSLPSTLYSPPSLFFFLAISWRLGVLGVRPTFPITG